MPGLSAAKGVALAPAKQTHTENQQKNQKRKQHEQTNLISKPALYMPYHTYYMPDQNKTNVKLLSDTN